MPILLRGTAASADVAPHPAATIARARSHIRRPRAPDALMSGRPRDGGSRAGDRCQSVAERLAVLPLADEVRVLGRTHVGPDHRQVDLLALQPLPQLGR